MAPEDEERVGDVSNVLFSNGWIAEDDGTVLIYYASSDTRPACCFFNDRPAIGLRDEYRRRWLAKCRIC